ncbi:MAG: DUF305 domain-containing protein [Pseudomonadota bacterium]|nr:DUF305 domain-containing protein [Pseudomonadota bacterium]
MSYWRFAAMIGTSTVVMFGLMYLNTYVLDHVLWSETRGWMALVMGASMAVIMLAFMLKMYDNRKVNIAIFAGSAVVFAAALWLVRSQATVDGVDYMQAMVPHHSIAILTSERAQITDARVRKLADEIIAAQRREIAEMKYLIHELESGGDEVNALDETQAQPRPVPAVEAVSSANIATTDLEELDEAEVERVLGRNDYCSFSYGGNAGPVLAASSPAAGQDTGRGVVKIHGRLVEVQAMYDSAQDSVASSLSLTADGMRIAVEAAGVESTNAVDGERTRETNARLHLNAGLTVGYRGFYACDSSRDYGAAAGAG